MSEKIISCVCIFILSVTAMGDVVKKTDKMTTSQKVKPSEPKPPPKSPKYGSVLIGLTANTSQVKVSDGTRVETVQMSGNSYGLAGAFEHSWRSLTFRHLVGYEQFKTLGAATLIGCDNKTSKDCKTDISYLTAGSFLRYTFRDAPLKIWGALGAYLKQPFSKTSTALVDSSMGTTFSYALALGADFQLNDSNQFVPFAIEQQFYNKSDSVDSRSLTLRVGLGKSF